MKTDIHNKDFATRLALKKRLRGNQKWPIDFFHNGGQIKYSFVLMLISPTSLVTASKFQKNICFKTRAVGLINIKTKECKSGRHL